MNPLDWSWDEYRFAGWFPWLPGGVAVGLVLVYLLDGWRRRAALERIGHLPQMKRMMATAAGWKRTAKAVLFITGATLVAIAVSRPQRLAEVTVKKRGIDLVVAMDFSKSMLARDMHPDRLSAMADEVDSLLDAMPSDRVGVVVFAGAAAHFPLTHDHDAARSLFRGLMSCPEGAQDTYPAWCAPLNLPPGSNLGEAALTGRCLLRPDLADEPGCERVGGHGRGGAPLGRAGEPEDLELPSERDLAGRARALVVYTDGDDGEGTARAEIARAVELGIDVYLVGVGTPEGELIPEFDDEGRETGWKKSEDGQSFVTSRLDQAGLEELAQLAGGEGHYVKLADPGATDELVRQLRRLQQGDADELTQKDWTDIYEWALLPGFMLLVIEACISGRRRRVLYPEEQGS
ncbi:MAG TPA: VWA domain-containing protein [Kofleriaceae bacterium]|nr:VWA domain-containing protein [Kofleriaceae bacterium]